LAFDRRLAPRASLRKAFRRGRTRRDLCDHQPRYLQP
jgi:hypothetical protein